MRHDVKKTVWQFYEPMQKEAHHRFRSWEHCYCHFRGHDKIKTTDQIKEASLHLAFYLASWGMMRGSTVLLQKDFLVHENAVREILNPAHTKLWDADIPNSREIDHIFDLTNKLVKIYKANNVKATDLLITKILMGTFGCVPAYDDYFKKGCRKTNVKPHSNFNVNSLRALINFYEKHKPAFSDLSKEIYCMGGIRYPTMKLIDMYFWKLGNPK